MTRKSKKQFKNQSQAEYMKNNEPQITGREVGKKNRIKTHSQSGCSMIEMLGVLAIIAVLSIGGIVGFRLAMNYYQANQIAHEMNMMRTDAQIKIAQGTEKLTLGSPYDSGNIQFNDYGTVFDCLDMETETSAPDKVVSCAVANAYYIELKEISEGVCKPLANLIDKMDNEVAFYINGKSVDVTEGEKGVCSEGLNTLKVIFGADSDSNAVKCDTDAECESLESTPFCDETRHICVQCTADDDCPYNTDYCEDNVCKTCENGVWNGENCVECTADGDCTDTPDTPVCYTEEYKCVECLTYENCTDTPETPQCDEVSHTCKSCAEIDSEKPLWTGTSCEACSEGKWNTNKNMCTIGECESNEDCNKIYGSESGYYCFLFEGYDCDNEFNPNKGYGAGKDGYESKCLNAKETSVLSEVEDHTYYFSDTPMTWQSAKRFCKALEKEMGKTLKMMSFESLGCQSSDLYCNSHLRQNLNKEPYFWLNNFKDECSAYYVHKDKGAIYTEKIFGGNMDGNYALCEED